jgi:hypothetical protein
LYPSLNEEKLVKRL